MKLFRFRSFDSGEVLISIFPEGVMFIFEKSCVVELNMEIPYLKQINLLEYLLSMPKNFNSQILLQIFTSKGH